jgi:hypothetical protein
VSHKIKIGLSVGMLLVNLFLWDSPAASAQTDTCPNAPPASLTVGQPALVTPGVPNNLRKSPSKTAEWLGAIQGDTVMSVLAGPTCADGLRWWNVTDGKLTGWMADGSGKDYYVIPIVTDPATVFTFDGVTPTPIAFRNIRLTYDGRFGKSLSIELNPITTPNANSQSPLFSARYTGLTFSDGEPSDVFPSIYIFPVADVNLAEGLSSAPTPDGTSTPAPLKCPKRADPSSMDTGHGAAMMLSARSLNLNFNNQGGSGIRYLAYFAQAEFPVLAHSLSYVFQGLTFDGCYYVYARFFNITANFLPEQDDPDFDIIRAYSRTDADMEARFKQYYGSVSVKINNAPLTSFSPRLDQIDALIQSIIVHYNMPDHPDWF